MIVDEKDKELMDEIIMIDDGTGSSIKIPSVMVSKTEGETIIDYYLNATEAERKRISIVHTFDINKPDDRVEYDIWLSSSNS